MTAHKILFLVLDGISDRPCPELGNRTPLQAAVTPILDGIAAEGACGIMDTIAPGIRPGSDTAHLSLLGYEPEKYYTGRGPLEAEGCGIHMEPGMIGFRCNYATLDDQGRVVDRRAGRIHGTEPLSQAIQEGVDLSPLGVEFFFRSGAGHRAALAFRGEGLGVAVTSNDPKKEGVPPLPFGARSGDEADRITARALAAFVAQAEEILRDHPVNALRRAQGLLPANTVLVRGAGKMGYFEPFSTKYGLSGKVISAAASSPVSGPPSGFPALTCRGSPDRSTRTWVQRSGPRGRRSLRQTSSSSTSRGPTRQDTTETSGKRWLSSRRSTLPLHLLQDCRIRSSSSAQTTPRPAA